MRSSLVGLLLGFSVASGYGCSSDDATEPAAGSSSSSSGGSSSSSGSLSGSSSSGSSGGSSSGSSGNPGALPTACDGTCRDVTLTITNGAKSGTFDRVQFGYNADGTLHVEAHQGGAAACPSSDSPDPDYSLIVTSPRPTASTALTLADGVSASFLDFQGDLVPEFPPPKVTAASLAPVAALLETTDSALYSFDFHAEFDQGAVVEGHGFATYCPSLDE